MAKYLLYIDTIAMCGGGGAQRVMTVLINHFLEDGIEIVLVNDYIHEDTSVVDELKSKYNDKIKIIYLAETIKGNKLLKNVKRIRKLRKIIKCEKPDVCLSFLGGCNIRLLACIRKTKKVKRIVSVRNDPNKEYSSNKLIKIIVNHLFKRADGVVFQTKEASSYFCKKVRDKSKVIMNPVDSRFFNATRTEPIYDIVALGRIVKQKNYPLLIDAFNLLHKDIPNIKLHIFGVGPLEGEMKSIVNSYNLLNHVIFEGSVKNSEEVLSKAKLYVLSSDHEGMPNALLEALAVGVPSISTDCPCGGPRALIQNDVNGILIPCGDVNSLYFQMSRLLCDDKLRDNFSRNAKVRSKEFETSKILLDWGKFIECVSNGKTNCNYY